MSNKFCVPVAFDLRVVSQAFTSEDNEPDESEATGSQRFQSQRARFEFLGNMHTDVCLDDWLSDSNSSGLFPTGPVSNN
jgi:hypothetical protein